MQGRGAEDPTNLLQWVTDSIEEGYRQNTEAINQRGNYNHQETQKIREKLGELEPLLREHVQLWKQFGYWRTIREEQIL